MVRCCLCATWFHEDCLGLDIHDRGVWPCFACRQLNKKVDELGNNFTTLMNMVSDMNKLLTTVNAKHQEEKSKIVEENLMLSNENKELRKTISDLNMKVNSLTWKSFRKSGQRSHVLIGSSIVRDVREEKLIDTEVICKRGGCISDAKTAVEQLTPGYESVTLIIGGNDCEAKPPKPAETIVKSYRELIDAAQEKCQRVTVSSICPRLSSDEVQDKIDSVNAGLVASCSEKEGVDFVDVTSSFRLADGSINDGYILPDGVHITRSAMNKMAAKLDLQIKDKKQGVCDTKYTKTDGLRQSTMMYSFSHSHSARIDPQASNESSWCFNCGEPNHVKDRCRHSRPLECHKCHQNGHKSKFCDYYTK